MPAAEIVLGVYPPASGRGGWDRVLAQEGLPWRFTQLPETPITLFADSLPAWLEAYVVDGGTAVVSGAPDADGLLAPSTLAVVHRFRPPGGGPYAYAPGLVRLFHGTGEGECRLHEDRKVKDGNDPGKFPAVLTCPVGRGRIVYTGIPLTQLLAAGGDCLRRFSPFTEVTERVASVDKAQIVDTLEWMLRKAFGLAGIPYVRPARFPDGAASVLLFRVDVDGLHGERGKDLSDVAARHGVPASFFFNGLNCEADPGTMEGWSSVHEIGHHGYRHNVFDDQEVNIVNLRQGSDWVQRHVGVSPTGFVAPRGLWNDSLDRALAAEGYRYSSDFALDFDSLPFRTPSGVLQIPVHPYCPERAVAYAEEQGLSLPLPEEVLAHYLAVARQQVEAGRPVHVYGHPEVLGAMAEKVLPELFSACAAEHLRTMTLSDFAAHWAAREEAGMILRFDAQAGQMTVDYAGHPFPIEVQSPHESDVTVTIAGETLPVPPSSRPVPFAASPTESSRR